MINHQLLEDVLMDQRKTFRLKELGVPRIIDFKSAIETKQIVFITGIRRCGKSVFLRQLAESFENYYYINFEDERLYGFELADFQNLMLVFQKQYTSKTIFIDEIQNIDKWELFIRRIYEEGYKIVVTGSNAKLLSMELATHLTGRFLKVELFPFGFGEYLAFKNVRYGEMDTAAKAIILKHFDEFIKNGGFPDNITGCDTLYLQSVYEGILYKDLIVRFGIRNTKAFKTLSQYLMTNFTGEISYNSLNAILGFKNVNTVKDYIDYLQQAYLIFECYKFDFSIKRQLLYNKKIYSIDNGLRNSLCYDFSENSGKQLENAVYIHLRRKYKTVWFLKTVDGYEVDFVVETPGGMQFIQVCQTLQNTETYSREIRALMEANKNQKSAQNIIITYNEVQTMVKEGITIKVIPAWQYFLDDML